MFDASDRFVAVCANVRTGCVLAGCLWHKMLSGFFFRVWPEEKTCVVTNVPLGGTPPAEMVSFGREQDEVGTGLKSFTVSQPGKSEV